jgi:hypothetical protein
MNRIYNKNKYKNYDEILSYLMGIYLDIKIDMKHKKLIQKQIDLILEYHPINYEINVKYILDKHDNVMV